MEHISTFQLNQQVHLELEYLKKYLKHLDDNIKVHSTLINTYLNEDLEEVGRLNELEMRAIYKDDLMKIPSYSYHSSYLLIYSLLESTLQKLGKLLQEELNLPIKLEDLKGTNYLSTSIQYIRSVIPMSQEQIDKSNDFVPYQLIRNLIVHNGSIIPLISKSKHKLLFVKFITYDPDGSFYIKDIEFLHKFLNKVEAFIFDCLKLIDGPEVVPVIISADKVIKYYTQEDYDNKFNPVIKSDLWYDDDDLPF
jgi:hypothetical protein